MLSYLDYLDLAEAAEANLISTASPEQKLQAGFLAMLGSYTAKLYWGLGDREFAARIRTALAIKPLVIKNLITMLVSIATTEAKTANGDFENLLTALYTHLKQKNKIDLSERLDELQVRVFIARDGSLLCTNLTQSLIQDAATLWRLPRKKYELYRLQALSSPDCERNLYIQTKAILSAYARTWSRSYRAEVNALITSTSDLNSLINGLIDWINNPVRFRGFTPDGDFEHAVTALYLSGHEAKLGHIALCLEGGEPRALRLHFPPTPTPRVASAATTPGSLAAAGSIEATISPAAANKTAAPPPFAAGSLPDVPTLSSSPKFS